MLAVERRAQAVIQHDSRAVEAHRRRQTQPFAKPQRIGNVQRGAVHVRIHAGEGIAHQHAAGHGQAGGVQAAELRAGTEAGAGAVVRQAHGQAMAGWAKLPLALRLDAEPGARLLGSRAIDGCAYQRRQGGNGVSVLVEHERRIVLVVAVVIAGRLVVFVFQTEERVCRQVVLAGRVLRVVAVVGGDVAAPPVEGAAQRDGADVTFGKQVQGPQVIARAIRPREYRGPVLGQQLGRRRAVAYQIRAHRGNAGVEAASAAAPAELDERLIRGARRIVAPAVLPQRGDGGEIAAHGAQPAARLAGDGASPELPRTQRRRGPGVAESILGRDRDSPAKRVQPEQGAGARQQQHAIDGGLGNQRPVHGVAERFVDANRILIHGDALRQAQQRRTDEAAILHVRLQRIALRLVDEHAGQLLRQERAQIQRATGGNRLRGRDLPGRSICIRSKRRHHRHHFHFVVRARWLLGYRPRASQACERHRGGAQQAHN